MGYTSTIVNLKQEPFTVKEGATVEEILKRIGELSSPEIRECFEYWFYLEVDEDGELALETTGEGGKAYDLDRAVNALIEAVAPFEDEERRPRGLRFSYELWGEGRGDAALYRSTGKELLKTEVSFSFDGETSRV